MTHSTINAFHLGDNLLHLHFLRKLAAAHPEDHFIHAAQEGHLWQLCDLVADVPNLSLIAMKDAAPGCINAWRGGGGWFYRHPARNDFVRVHLDWFALLAKRMGYESPIKCAADMLFDYPALKVTWDAPQDCVLVVNSRPLSGQWTGFSSDLFDQIVSQLRSAGHHVITTNPAPDGRSVTNIGQISQHCRAIVGVATGPIWPTFNAWNRTSVQLRLLLNDSEVVNIEPATTVHAHSLHEVPQILREHAIL